MPHAWAELPLVNEGAFLRQYNPVGAALQPREPVGDPACPLLMWEVVNMLTAWPPRTLHDPESA